MKNLTQEEVFQRLCIHYHDDFQTNTKGILSPDEVFWGVGNWSLISKNRGSLGVTWKYIGYYLITSYRVLRVRFEAEQGLFSDKRRKIKISSRDSAFEVPDFPLTKNEIKTRWLFEIPLKQITFVNRIDVDNNSKDLLGISATHHHHALYFKKEEGETIYRTLIEIIHNDSEPSNPIPNLVEQLEKLKELHRYQVITDEEFEAAKKRLGL